MAIKPEDKPKLIGLIVALGGVLAYVLIALVPKLTAGASEAPHNDPPPPALTAASATASGTTGQSGTGEASAALPDEDSAPIPQPPARDSFTPPPAASHAPMAVAAAPTGKPIAAAAKAWPMGIGPVIPGGVIAVPITGLPPAAPLPSIELKGVIVGEQSVAVISVNGEVVERQTGEIIAAGLKLVKISEVGITVQDGKQYMPVTVGHAMTAPAAQAPPPQAAAMLVKTTR